MPPHPRLLPRPIVKPVVPNTSDVFRSPFSQTVLNSPSPLASPSVPLSASAPPFTPQTYNPYQYYQATPQPLIPLTYNPYGYHLTTPLHYPPMSAYPYSLRYQMPALLYQTPPIISRAAQNPASPVENSPPPPRDANPSSSSSP